MTLRGLEIGDIFIHAKSKSKSPKRFVIITNPYFNIRHGAACRRCRDLGGREYGKSCNLEVKKVGESIHKAKLLQQHNHE